jgi:hypothetical protein
VEYLKTKTKKIEKQKTNSETKKRRHQIPIKQEGEINI